MPPHKMPGEEINTYTATEKVPTRLNVRQTRLPFHLTSLCQKQGNSSFLIRVRGVGVREEGALSEIPLTDHCVKDFIREENCYMYVHKHPQAMNDEQRSGRSSNECTSFRKDQMQTAPASLYTFNLKNVIAPTLLWHIVG